MTRRVVLSKLPSRLRARIAQMEISHPVSGGPGGEKRVRIDQSATALGPVVEQQAFETAVAKWGARDVFEVLGHALAGLLDVFPRAVGDDLRDSVRKQERRDQLLIEFRPRPSRRRLGREERAMGEELDVPLPDGVAAAAPLAPDDAAVFRKLCDRIRSKPRWRALADAYAQCGPDVTQVELAARLDVTDRAVRDILAEIRAEFRRLARL